MAVDAKKAWTIVHEKRNWETKFRDLAKMSPQPESPKLMVIPKDNPEGWSVLLTRDSNEGCGSDLRFGESELTPNKRRKSRQSGRPTRLLISS